MNTEFEAKFLDITPDGIRAKLANVGAKCQYKERLSTRVLFGRRGNDGMKVNYVRVRDEGEGVIRLSAKVHAELGGKLTDQKETDVTVSDFDDTVAILELAGLQQTERQETKRELWMLQGAEVTIDTWPQVDTYIEIEGQSEQQVKDVAALLEVSWEDKWVTSIVDIIMQNKNMTRDEVYDLLKESRFPGLAQ